jgi:hypothetical protein
MSLLRIVCGERMDRGRDVRGVFGVLCWAFFLFAIHDATWAQSPSEQWVSEEARAEIEIYDCSAVGHAVSNQKLLDTHCGYVTDKGLRLCGRVVKVLPKGIDGASGQRQEA